MSAKLTLLKISGTVGAQPTVEAVRHSLAILLSNGNYQTYRREGLVLHFPLAAHFVDIGGAKAKISYDAELPTDRTGPGRDANPWCPPELKECWNKLPAMNSSAACIMCFHISNARPS